MKEIIYCKTTAQGTHSFYITTSEGTFYLFSQNYRKGVGDYYRNGVLLEQALDFSKSQKDTALIKTMKKMPMYIRYIERENGLVILKKTAKNHSRRQVHGELVDIGA